MCPHAYRTEEDQEVTPAKLHVLSRTTLGRPPHRRLPVVGESKLANHLVKLVVTSYTGQWSTLAPAGILM
jgi:hypothetical protein